MPVRKAQRLCPDLILLPPNPRLYARASRALHEIFRIYAPTIEPRGYGHAFLDLTGTGQLFGPPQDVAARIRRETSQRLGFPVTVGIASNKLVSQAAIKADRWTGGRADGRTGWQLSDESLYVPAGDERGFLAPHPLEVLPELGTSMRTRLEEYQLDLIGEIAVIPESALCAVFGREGRTLRARAQGIDPRPVLPPERQAEFRLAHALPTDTNDIGVLYPLLRLMSERLGRRLRRRGLTAGRLRVEATYADYTAGARAVPLRAAILDAELWDAARRAFVLANSRRLAVRAIALTLDRLMEDEAQLDLWEVGTACPERSEGAVRRYGDRAEKMTALQSALDRIRSHYGTQAVAHSTAVPPYRRNTGLHHSTTIFPKVALPSMTRCASAS
jgi:DNA polymerase-4